MSTNRNGPHVHLHPYPNTNPISYSNQSLSSRHPNSNLTPQSNPSTSRSPSTYPRPTSSSPRSVAPRSTPATLSLAQAVTSAHEFHAATSSSRPSVQRNTSNGGGGEVGGSTNTSNARFKAPAHKHAHHLHSIPPKEKSTRTLIIDHLLWVHGRTRFAQARAELGMTDRTGGSSSSNYVHRKRPENYEEDEQVESDGEDVAALQSMHDFSSYSYGEGRGSIDLPLAQSLRLRTEGLEKVINSMLVQPPPVHLQHTTHLNSNGDLYQEDLYLDPNQHTLPNGVRVRLALGTLVNDFFARQAPPPPFRHKRFRTAAGESPLTSTTPGASAATPGTASSDSTTASGLLPPALSILAEISAYSRGRKRRSKSSSSSSHRPSSSSPRRPSESEGNPGISPHTQALYLSGTDPETANSPPAFRCPRHLHTGCEICVEAKEEFGVKGPSLGSNSAANTNTKGKGREMPLPRPRGTSFAGPSWPSTSASTSAMVSGTASLGAAMGAPIGISPDGGGISGYQDPGVKGGCSVGVGEGLLKPSPIGSVLRRRTAAPYTKRSGRGWGGGIGAVNDEASADSTGSGYTKLSELLPRFLRLSALVAIELGREVGEGREGMDERDEKEEGNANAMDDREMSGEGEPEPVAEEAGSKSNPTSAPSSEGTATGATPATFTTKQGIGGPPSPSRRREPLRPSREWYHLLAGILTRAVLQGYLTAGWRGVDAVECLLGVGMTGAAESESDNMDVDPTSPGSPTAPGSGPGPDKEVDHDEDPSPSESEFAGTQAQEGVEPDPDDIHQDDTLFKEFDPDELPSLREAVWVLFPSFSFSLSSSNVESGGIKGGRRKGTAAEREYVREMRERLRKFSSPNPGLDLSTHMEDLAYEYPAEPVERAAARFCEAVAGWRGKPELEGYKKKPPRTWPSFSSGSPGMAASAPTPMPLESLVHLNPNSPTVSTITSLPGQGQRASTDLNSSSNAAGDGTDARAGAEGTNENDIGNDNKKSSSKPKMKNPIDLYFIHPDHPDIIPINLTVDINPSDDDAEGSIGSASVSVSPMDMRNDPSPTVGMSVGMPSGQSPTTRMGMGMISSPSAQYQLPRPGSSSGLGLGVGAGSSGSGMNSIGRRQSFESNSAPDAPTGASYGGARHPGSQTRSNSFPQSQTQQTQFQPSGSGNGNLTHLTSGGGNLSSSQSHQQQYQQSIPSYYSSSSGSGSGYPMQMQVQYSPQPYSSQQQQQQPSHSQQHQQMQMQVPGPVPVWDPSTGGWTSNQGHNMGSNKRTRDADRSPERAGGMGGPNAKRPR